MSAPRALAHQILGERRFHQVSIPHPLDGLLNAIGNAINAITGLVNFGSDPVIDLLAVCLLVFVVLLVHRRGNRTLPSSRRTSVAAAPSALDGGALDRAALDAERAGRYEAALRLHFQAGLLRLAERELIEYRPSLRSHEIAAHLRSSDFDALTARFDEVVYGGATAQPSDPPNARAHWAAVLK